MQVEVVPTGCLNLDFALGVGGLPKGRIIEIFGPESSGKTTLALHAVAQAQKAGGTAAFIDAEHALDPVYAKKLGVDIDELYVSQPDNGEQALDICEALVRSGAIDIVVIDSVAALVPKAEIDGDMGDSHVGLQARLMSQALRKLAGVISKTNAIAIFINQLREKVGVVYGNPEVTTGGKALKFYASVRIDIRKSEAIKDGTEIIGNRVKIKIVKNKVAPPFKSCTVDMLYGEGISREGEVLDLAVERDLIKKSGSFYSYEGERIAQGRDAARKYIKEHPEVFEALETKIRAAFQDRGVGGNVTDEPAEKRTTATKSTTSTRFSKRRAKQPRSESGNAAAGILSRAMKAPQPENRGRRYAGDLTRRKRRQDGRRAPHGKCSRRGVAVAQEGAAELPRKRTAFPATATALSAGDAPARISRRCAPHGRCSRRSVAVAQEGAAELPRKRTAFPATATALSAGDAPARISRRCAPHGKCSRRGVAVAQEGAAELPRKRTAFPATATAFSAGGAPRANFKALRPAREMFPAGASPLRRRARRNCRANGRRSLQPRPLFPQAARPTRISRRCAPHGRCSRRGGLCRARRLFRPALMRIVDAAIHGARQAQESRPTMQNKGFRAIREGIFAMNVGLSGSATSRRGTQWKKAWPSVLSSPSAETLP